MRTLGVTVPSQVDAKDLPELAGDLATIIKLVTNSDADRNLKQEVVSQLANLSIEVKRVASRRMPGVQFAPGERSSLSACKTLGRVGAMKAGLQGVTVNE